MGGFAHEDYRSFCNERRTHSQKAFIDGDLIEHLLDLSHEEQEAIVRQFNNEYALSLSSAQSSSNTTACGTGTGTSLSSMGVSPSASQGQNNVKKENQDKRSTMSTDMMSHLVSETSIFHPNHKQTKLYTVDEIIHKVEDFARLH